MDLELERSEHVFNVRAAAIQIVDGKVLLQRRTGDAAWALPGGKVAFGETAAEAVVRELREELALEAIVTRLVWLAESFFKLEGRDVHQLGSTSSSMRTPRMRSGRSNPRSRPVGWRSPTWA